jgi:hypothetical protein
METSQVEKISKQDLESIKAKMYFFDIYDGYIGQDKGNLVLFLRPCSKATDYITLTQVQNAIDKYNKGEL